ncbi:MAG: S8 family serine peptidase [Rhodospirillaceae bacterium]
MAISGLLNANYSKFLQRLTLGVTALFLVQATQQSLAQDFRLVRVGGIDQKEKEPEWASRLRDTLTSYANSLEETQSSGADSNLINKVGVLIFYRTPESSITKREGKSSTELSSTERLSTKASSLSSAGIEVVRALNSSNALRARVGPDDINQLISDKEIRDVHVERFDKIQQDREGKSLFIDTGVVEADTLWDTGYTGTGQVIAVLDDGIFASHEAFSGGKIVEEACFSTSVSSIGVQSLCPQGLSGFVGSGAASVCNGETSTSVCWHGTHVAGIAAGNDPVGGVLELDGVAYNASIIPVQVFVRITNSIICGDETPPCYRSSSLDQFEALEWLKTATSQHNIVSVNMSLGGGSYSNYCYDDLLVGPIEDLKDLGVLTTIAAGNGGEIGAVSQPACVEAAIAVSSISFGVPSSFANHAEIVDFLAPGDIVFSATFPPSTYSFSSGTSMAAPFVAGAIALIREARPNATVEQIEYALRYSSEPVTNAAWSWETPNLKLGEVLNLVDDYVAPSGTRLLGVQTSNNGLGNISLLRVFNAEDESAEVTFTFVDDLTGEELGRYTTNVRGKASFEFGVPDLENVMGIMTPGESTYTTIVNSRFAGFVSHIIRNEISGIWMDATNCVAGVTSDQRVLMNVPTTRFIAGYQPLVLVHNGGDREASPTLSAYSFRDGTFLGQVTTETPILPATTIVLESAEIFERLGYEPESTEFYFNMVLEPGFEGTVGQALQHDLPELTANMSDRCAVN